MISKVHFHFFICSLVVLVLGSCKKDKYANPYDDPALDPPAESVLPDISDHENFAYLHAKIFKPTCANSGCHDGTFPPDYRTITSTYYTLVYQKPVNTAGNVFRYRVYPFKADSSILYHRLTIPLGSGLMPLVVDPGSDWNTKKNEHILDIKNWINAGAKDMFGNYPKIGNKQPQITGLLIFPSGNTTTPYPRTSSQGPVEVPSNSSLDLWFVLEDDSTLAQNIINGTCKITKMFDNFSTASTSGMSYMPGGIVGLNFSGASVQFTHKATIGTAGFLANTLIYVRAYVNDGSQGANTEIPNNGSDGVVKTLFTLKIK